jgi:hypothetical protein
MNEQRTFVGRQAELNRFREVLEDPRGQAVVVVGQASMGKTWLIDRMTQLATQHPKPKCASGHGYAALFKQIEPLLSALRQATEGA